MAGRNLWALNGNGILSGAIVGADQADESSPNSADESPWTQALRWASTNPAPAISSPQTFGGFLGAQASPPRPPTMGFGSSQPLTFPLPSVANTSAALPAIGNSSIAPSLSPVSYQWDAAKPWLWPPFPDIWDQWRRGAIDSMKPLFRRGYGGGAGSPRGDDYDECDDRQARERQACFNRAPDMAHEDFLDACLKRATQRWLACLKNGYPGGPGEMPQWGKKDEEIWRNFDR